jgi:hypothetical protein
MSVSETKENDPVKQALNEIELKNLPNFFKKLQDGSPSEELKKREFLRQILKTKITKNADYTALQLSPLDVVKYAAVSMIMGWPRFEMALPDFIVYLHQQGVNAETLNKYATIVEDMLLENIADLAKDVKMRPQKLTDYAAWAKKLSLFEKNSFKPLSHACQWVEPNAGGLYSSPSLNFSMLALITCVTAGINMGALFQAWWTWINTIIKPVYNQYKDEPAPLRVAHVWQALKKSSQVCYRTSGINYLHSILMYNSCQCSCGVQMMLEVMNSVDPTIKVATLVSLGHIQLIVFDKNDKPYVLETTSSYEVDPEMIVHRLYHLNSWSTWGLFPSSVNELAHLDNWMRIFTDPYKTTKNQDLLWQSMCNLQTVFRLLPETYDSMAFSVFRCFAGYANAFMEQNSEEQERMQKCLKAWLENPMMPKLTNYEITREFIYLQNMAKDYLEDSKTKVFPQCNTLHTSSVQRQMQKVQRTFYNAPSLEKPNYIPLLINQMKELELTGKVGTLYRGDKNYLRKKLNDKAWTLFFSSGTNMPLEAAMRLAAGMIWENPTVFESDATAYMKYLDDNKISPEDFKKKSKWTEDYDMVSWDYVEAQERLKKVANSLTSLSSPPLSYIQYDWDLVEEYDTLNSFNEFLERPEPPQVEIKDSGDAGGGGGFDFSGGAGEGGGFDFSGGAGENPFASGGGGGAGENPFASGGGAGENPFASGGGAAGAGKNPFASGGGAAGAGKNPFASGGGAAGAGKNPFASGGGAAGAGKNPFAFGTGAGDGAENNSSGLGNFDFSGSTNNEDAFESDMQTYFEDVRGVVKITSNLLSTPLSVLLELRRRLLERPNVPTEDIYKQRLLLLDAVIALQT